MGLKNSKKFKFLGFAGGGGAPHPLKIFEGGTASPQDFGQNISFKYIGRNKKISQKLFYLYSLFY